MTGAGHQKMAGWVLGALGIVVTIASISPIVVMTVVGVAVVVCVYGALGRGIASLPFLLALPVLGLVSWYSWLASGPNSAGSEHEFSGFFAALLLGPVVAVLGTLAARLGRATELGANRPEARRPGFRSPPAKTPSD